MTMWMTIASLHLIAVVAVALWSRSRFMTWIAAAIILFVAFAKGSSSYGFVDAISTLIGLGMGLSMVPKPATIVPPQKRNEGMVPAAVASITPPSKTALARDFELTPSPRRYPIGRWILLAVVAIILMWTLLKS